MSAPTTRPLADALTLASETQHGVVQLAADGESAAGKAVTGADGRLDNPRDPNPHAASHATAGGDPLAPADIGAAGAVHTHTSADVTDFTEASQDVTGAMVAAAGGTYDDAAGTITLPAGGHEIRDAGTPLTQRAGFNIIVGSSGATLADDAANDQTTFDVSSLTGGGGSGAWAVIAEQILSASAASVTFSSIPGTYRHLALVYVARSDRSGQATDGMGLQVNGDTAANYDSNGQLWGDTTVTDANTGGTFLNAGNITGATATAGEVGLGVIFIGDYARNAWRKQVQTDGSVQAGGGVRGFKYFGHWKSTAAVTSMTLLSTTGSNLVSGSVLTLYGITNS